MTPAEYLYNDESTDIEGLLQFCEYSALKIETKQSYALIDSLPNLGEEDISSLLQRFLAGEELPRWTPENNEWLQIVAAQRQAGRRIRRVLILTQPLSDFRRFELTLLQDNVAAGEEVMVAEHDHPGIVRRGLMDFWVFDGEYAVALRHDDAGRLISSGSCEDVGPYRRWAGHAIEVSVPLSDYLREH